ncbi:MAG: SAM-dependent methyltransferase [Paucimonas sp.]|jgi:methyltransferase (TIGR00027 family)|uniref:class I SAM-dependent methyltransferase n=1 Tax=Pantoea sp. Cy-639 TaxID=2608360 RepID=UPI001422DF85|nr:SAM-dependent methyltransferase [Pantoea sp. Cy-639]MDR2309209.1 SAM-dependent methyltransferase [Paucimonas sp.]NIF18468.1 class I SAM-dependent methyltransferase [Pantoea sp. Cy-639]
MQGQAASWTALFASIARAAHQVLDGHPKLLDDPVVVGLVEGTSVSEIRAQAAQFDTPMQRLVRSLFVLRSRFVEDRLRAAVESGVKQYIVLGAGLDTFAYRQPPWAAQLSIIEVDHPASQARKRDYLSRAGVAVAGNVSFCPLDFERERLMQGLRSSDFDSAQPAFFSWLGVTQYLTGTAIKDVLGEVSSCAPGSAIALSFVLADGLLSGLDAQTGNHFAALAQGRGEPWLSRLSPEQLRTWLHAAGFARVQHARPEALQRHYYGRRTDGLTVPVFEQLMDAWL